jgi:hypothetical protein
MRFKEGDLVFCEDDRASWLQAGAVYKVLSTIEAEYGQFVQVYAGPDYWMSERFVIRESYSHWGMQLVG